MKPLDPRLLRQAAPARRLLVTTVLAGVATSVAVLLQAQLLAHALAHLSGGLGALGPTLLLLLLVLAVRAGLGYLTEVDALRAASAVRLSLRGRLLAAVLRDRGRPRAGTDAGEIAALATRGLDGLDAYFARYLPQLVLATVVPVVIVVRVATTDWLSAVTIGVTLPLIPLFMALVGLHTKARTEQQWRLLARLGGHFLDVLQGLATLTAFGRARAQADVIRRFSDQHRRATLGTLRIAFLSALVLELLATLATALVAVQVGLRLLAGDVPYETALLVLLLAPEAYLPLRALGVQFHASMEGAEAVTGALDLITGPVTDDDGARSSGSGGVRPDGVAPICFRNVRVEHAGRTTPALDGASFDIRAGEMLALTGPNGAGKSTALAVLLGLVEPSSGGVTVAGRSLAELDLGAWWRQIAWVPQRPHLFAGTVADNIRLGRSEASDAEVAGVALRCGLKLPSGLMTDVGEGGRALSSGQRQRVALARAILRDAPLLLLDEPTAHLDDASAAAVRALVARERQGRTVVVVTHDAAWEAAADRTLLFDAGTVNEVSHLRTAVFA